MSELVTVKPKVKLKGFDPENLKISSATKDHQQVINRIIRLKGTSLFTDINDKKRN